MPRRIKLDRIDRRILRDLQENGRMTNVDLARRAGISAPPCLRRVRALEEAGLIKGYHADVDGPALGYGVTVFAMVGLSSQAEPDLEAFEAMVAELDEVRECHMLAGETDFLLKIVATDWEAYQQLQIRARRTDRRRHAGHGRRIGGLLNRPAVPRHRAGQPKWTLMTS